MGLNGISFGERVHIGFFGCRNAGKSSVVNAVTGQELAVVSDVKGTTTDPVYKSMELLPLGPVVIIDTPGFDDYGALGSLRVKKTKQVLNKCDAAVLVIDGTKGAADGDFQMLSVFREKNIPFVVALNKKDIAQKCSCFENAIYVSAKTGEGIFELKEKLARLIKIDADGKYIVGDLISSGDTVVLVTPIDSAAPRGRLILPQQQTLRDILDADAVSVVVKESQLKEALFKLNSPPSLVITDSQVFDFVSKTVPRNIPLTSFSILMARYKGYLKSAVAGAAAIDRLQNGDTVLIAEGCTHHRQCDDIGTVKIPRRLKEYTGKNFEIKTVSGTEFPEDLTPFSLIIHCGGCMLGEREVRCRVKCAQDACVPITNYGVALAYMQGILTRCLEILPDILECLKQ